jgi:hypothetical protein
MLLLQNQKQFSMRQILALIILALIISSCGHREKFPGFVTEKIPLEELVLEEGVTISGKPFLAKSPSADLSRLDSLQKLQEYYLERDEHFNLAKYWLHWRMLKNEVHPGVLLPEEAIRWFELTGFLFQLTGDAEVAEELDRVIHTTSFGQDKDMVTIAAPYIFTRNLDQVHVNLFLPAQTHFTHSLGGDVKIKQETVFPESGKIILKFSMEQKRYIELFIRIPSWAQNSRVTVKGVKYLSHAGSYSRVAKQWKEGDFVEVEFSLENMPAGVTSH